MYLKRAYGSLHFHLKCGRPYETTIVCVEALGTLNRRHETYDMTNGKYLEFKVCCWSLKAFTIYLKTMIFFKFRQEGSVRKAISSEIFAIISQLELGIVSFNKRKSRFKTRVRTCCLDLSLFFGCNLLTRFEAPSVYHRIRLSYNWIII